jgi:hypothetical protein
MGGLVYFAWTFVGIVAIGSVGGSIYLGYSGYRDLVFWRRIKLASTVLGVIGIAFLMLNAEAMLRSGYYHGLTPSSILIFTDVRFEVAEKVPEICARYGQTSKACEGALKVQRSLEWPRLNIHSAWVEEYDKTRYAPELDKFLDDVNGKIGWLQHHLKTPEAYWTPSTDARVLIFFLAAIVLALALGGSAGEAAFQLQQAESDARRKASAAAAGPRVRLGENARASKDGSSES